MKKHELILHKGREESHRICGTKMDHMPMSQSDNSSIGQGSAGVLMKWKNVNFAFDLCVFSLLQTKIVLQLWKWLYFLAKFHLLPQHARSILSNYFIHIHIFHPSSDFSHPFTSLHWLFSGMPAFCQSPHHKAITQTKKLNFAVGMKININIVPLQ